MSEDRMQEECFAAMRDGDERATMRVAARDLARVLGENARLREQVAQLQARGTELTEESRAARADAASSLRKCVEAWAEVDAIRVGVGNLIKRVRGGVRAA